MFCCKHSQFGLDVYFNTLLSSGGARRKSVVISSALGSSGGNADASAGSVAGQRAAQALRSSIRIDPAYMVLPQYESAGTGRRQTRVEDDPGSPRGGRRQTRIEQSGSGEYSARDDAVMLASRASPSKSRRVSVLSGLGSIFTKEKPTADESTRTLRGTCVIDVPCDLQHSSRGRRYCFVGV